MRAWGIVPAAVSERDVATNLPEAGRRHPDLLVDKGFNGKAIRRLPGHPRHRRAGPATKSQRRGMPPALQKIIAEWHNRIEATFGEITDLMELARHGADSFWGLLTVPPRPLPPTPRSASAALISPRHRSTHIMRLRPGVAGSAGAQNVPFCTAPAAGSTNGERRHIGGYLESSLSTPSLTRTSAA